MREVHKIALTGISDVKRMKAIDVISAALVSQYHKNVMVLQEGHASDAAIDAIPSSITVFIICGEPEKIEEKAALEQPADAGYRVGDIIKPKDGANFIVDEQTYINAIIVNDNPLCAGVNSKNIGGFKFFLVNESAVEFVDSPEPDYHRDIVSAYQKTRVI
jgi:hypothetical protein